MIHPTAIIHAGARLDPTVEVGPYAVIGENVVLGAGCRVGAHVCIMGHTTAGEANVFWPGAHIGGDPQDLKYKGEPTRLRIGNGNVFREMATIHCANKPEEDTVIGDECLFMVNSHVGHNAIVGNRVILANGALIAGHCILGDRVFVSGNVAIHQFVRIGELTIVQGLSAMSCDVPPFVIACDRNMMGGLNTIGLRRAGFTAEDRAELKLVYKLLFRARLKREDAIHKAEQLYRRPASLRMIDFVKNSRRGIISDIEMTRSTILNDLKSASGEGEQA